MKAAFSIDDARVYPMIVEGDLCTGGTTDPEYDDATDVGCVNSFEFSEEVLEKERKGDDTTCGDVSRLQKVGFKIKYTNINPELLELLLSLEGEDQTVGADDGRRTKRKKSQRRVRFGLIVRSVDETEEKDIHYLLWNCRLKAAPPVKAANEEYAESELEGTAYLDPETCDTFYDYIQHHDGVTDIPTAWPGNTAY